MAQFHDQMFSPSTAHTEDWVSLFTTLYDDDPSIDTQTNLEYMGDADVVIYEAAPPSAPFPNPINEVDNADVAMHDAGPPPASAPDSSIEVDRAENGPTLVLRTAPRARATAGTHGIAPERTKASRKCTTKPRSQKEANLPGFGCFSLANGTPANIPRRTAFSLDRREEVKQVRKIGACLRCKLRKITCSGGDPCRACLDLLQVRGGSRVLMWMECIRTSFSELSIFLTPSSTSTLSKAREFFRGIPTHTIHLDKRPLRTINPFMGAFVDLHERNLIQLNKPFLSLWAFSKNFELEKVSHIMGPSLSQVVHLPGLVLNLVGAEPQDESQQERLQLFRELLHYAINELLKDLELGLKPTRLETSSAKLEHLNSLLVKVVLLWFTVRLNVFGEILSSRHIDESIKRKTDELIRLLYHYFLYLGNILRLIDPIDDCWTILGGFKWDAAELACTPTESESYELNILESSLTLLRGGANMFSVPTAVTKELDSNQEAIPVQSG